MSWTAYAASMHDHGAEWAGVYSQSGDLWGQYNMAGVTKQEIETLVGNLRSGTREMYLAGKKCIVMNMVQSEFMTGKSLTPVNEGEENRLWHVVLGKTCVYLAARSGPLERSVVNMLDTDFINLKEY